MSDPSFCVSSQAILVKINSKCFNVSSSCRTKSIYHHSNYGDDPCIIITACQRSYGKVTFLLVSVCWEGEGVPMWPLPMMYWTSLYRSQAPSRTSENGPPPPDIRHGTHWPCPLLETSDSHHWRSVQTCSLLEDSPPIPLPLHQYWHITHGRQAGGTRPTGMFSCCWLMLCNVVPLFPVHPGTPEMDEDLRAIIITMVIHHVT